MSNLKKQIASLTESLLDAENEILVWAEETDNNKVLAHAANVLVKAARALEEVSALTEKKLDYEMSVEAGSIHPRDIESLAALAAEFDASDDEFLQKQAAVIDQLLINFAQKGLKSEAESAEEKELAKLRAKYRAESSDECYKGPREEHEKDIKAAEAVKAIKDQVKEYRPLETALSTRYCPDHPGSQVRRVGDNVYQCALDKKIYNYKEGFTTEKGNKVPGTDVANQTQNLGDRKLEEMSFSTRENRLNANASEEGDSLVKKAQDTLEEEVGATINITDSYFKSVGMTSRTYTTAEWDEGMDSSVQASNLVKTEGDKMVVLSYIRQNADDSECAEIANGLSAYIKGGLHERVSASGLVKVEDLKSGAGAQSTY
jgi:hypothetical protein